MTKEQAKEVLPAIEHFANGGELFAYEQEGVWFKQQALYIEPKEIEIYNIIQDKDFEARKAFALGKAIQCRPNTSDKFWGTCDNPEWFTNYDYRPKEEVYEWQCTDLTEKGDRYTMTSQFFTEEEVKEYGWTKFEPSKRIKR